jgi:hypothetical protein
MERAEGLAGVVSKAWIELRTRDFNVLSDKQPEAPDYA